MIVVNHSHLSSSHDSLKPGLLQDGAQVILLEMWFSVIVLTIHP